MLRLPSLLPTVFLAGSLTCLFALAVSGCSDQVRTDGGDIAFLNAPVNIPIAEDSEVNLLPLTRGNSWQMRTITRGTRYDDRVKVVGPSQITETSSIEIATTRDGQPWRSEYYVPGANEIRLSGSQDETSPLMVYDPPIPLAKIPFAEGQSWQWRGTLTIKGVTFPARAFTRVSGRDSITTAAGKFKAYRLDTILTMNSKGKEILFPSVRWLAPGVGFVRRGFADQGQPASSELLQFDVH